MVTFDKSDFDTIEKFEVLCRRAGLKVTPQRIAVYKALSGSKDHPSADSVYKLVRQEIRNISFDTVNRTLSTLSEIGAAFVVEGSGDVKRFDGNLKSHQHFKCVKCKKIIDFHHDPFNNIELPESVEQQFTVLRKTVLLEGLCRVCKPLTGDKCESDK
ncbi:MAG: transcriptional repressor [Phycisphaerae bacterium]|nr:transcriptional repressor [Phycisphaerae bacterium]